jgi:ATP-dependent exoDNAse (exonuclease V) alpha subunit/5S rRNA maturation endonuclease (ribonuclease M5)
MALYHCSFGVVSRGNGGSAVAKAAYNAACKLVEQIFDKATGIYTSVIHDYSKKKGVVYSEILAPEITQGMYETREDLWNKVQLNEVRKDAQYSRKLTLALPSELSVEENIDLLRNYINESFVREGMIADLSVHMDDENNPHAHVQLTLRNIELDEGGKPSFGLKNISWNRKDMLQTWRSLWAVYVNKALEVRGFNDRISELSHEERGIELTPGIKEGPARYMKSAERRELNSKIQRSNEKRIKDNPELIIDKLSINKAAFTKVDIAREVGKYFGVKIGKTEADLESLNQINASEFLTAYGKVLSSEKLAILANNSLNGEILYTSSARIKLEQRLVDTVSKLKEDYNHSLGITEKDLGEFSFTETVKENIKGVGKAIESTVRIDLGIRKNIELSSKQKQAVLYALNGPSISIIEGLPGAGKSTVVREITRQLGKKGYRVVGGAVSSSASRNLAEAGGIFTQNLSKWRYDIESYERDITGEKFNPALSLDYYEKELYQKRPSYFTNRDVFILDEMSMVSLPDFDFIKNEILKAGGKIINLGDNNQLGAIKLQGASSKTTEIAGSYVLDEVKRQDNPLHRKATVLMSNYRLKEALEIYKETKVFETAANREQLREKLVNNYTSEYLIIAKEEGIDHLSSHGKMAIIAYTNDEVRELNLLVREKLKTAGIIKGNTFKLVNSTGILEFGIGEQIVFTRNSKRCGVENGDFGIVKSIQGNVLGVELIRDKKSYNIDVDTKDYKSIDYGYAQTIYKAQGKTYDYVKALFESLTGYQVFNVMMTRHVKDLKCYIDQDMIDSNLHNNVEYKKEEKLTSAILNSITRRAKSDFSIEYLNSDNLPEVKTLKAYIEAKEDVLELHKAIEREKGEIFKRDGIHISTWESKYAEDYKEVLRERLQLAQEICKDFDSYKGLISQTRLSFEVIATHAGLEGYKKEYSKGNQLNATRQNNITLSPQVIQLAQDIKDVSNKEHGLLFESANEPLRISIEGLRSKLIYEQEEKVLNIKDLELKVNDLRQGKYKAEADLTNAKYFVEEAFPYILNKTFKDGEAVLKTWNALKKERGFSGALQVVEKDISVLGKLQGMGIGNFFALSSARQDALSHVKNLPENFKKYEENRVMIQDKAAELKENYWDKGIIKLQTNIKYLESAMLDTKSYEFVKNIRDKSSEAETLINFAKDKEVQSWINKIQKINNAMEKLEKNEVGNDKKSNQGYDNNQRISRNFKMERESLSFDEVNAKLTQYAKELGYELLPQITGDKVEEASRGVLKCGSIMLETSGTKAGLWFRFSKGEGGNLFDLIKEANGYNSSVESLKWGAEWLGMSHNDLEAKSLRTIRIEQEVSQPVKIKELIWKTVSLVPKNAPAPNIDKCFTRLQSTHIQEAVYTYKDSKGDIIGYVVRFKDEETGLKQTLPLIWAENIKTGRQGWKSQGFEGKPIYGLEKLNQDRKTVVIVEGEKTADAASTLLPEYTVISWLGGTNSASQVDWKILEGRKVVIWPDNDAPGIKAAEIISEKLEGVAHNIAIVNPYLLKFAGKVHENTLSAKWDLADNLPAGITNEGIREAIRNAQNARLELTSENLKAAIDKAGIDDKQLYAQVCKQVKELAATSKLYHDSESLVKQVISNIKAADGQIRDTGFTAAKEALKLSDIVKGEIIGNKFHENLLSHIYIKQSISKKFSLSERLSQTIKAYDKLEKGLTLLLDGKYEKEINTACDSLQGKYGVSRKAADVYMQAVKDIVLYDKVTTQAIHQNTEYFSETIKYIRDIFVENKNPLAQAGDAFSASTVKNIYNKLYEKLVCNENIADKLLERQSKAITIQAKHPTFAEIESRMKELNITDKATVDRAYMHVLERFEPGGGESLSDKQFDAICQRSFTEANILDGWKDHFREELYKKHSAWDYRLTPVDQMNINIDAEHVVLLRGRLTEEAILKGLEINKDNIGQKVLDIYNQRQERIEHEFESNPLIVGLSEKNKQAAEFLAENIVDYKDSYGNTMTTERLEVMKNLSLNQAILTEKLSANDELSNNMSKYLTPQQLGNNIEAIIHYTSKLLHKEFNRNALENLNTENFNKINTDNFIKDMHDSIVVKAISQIKQLQNQYITQRQQELDQQMQHSKSIDLDK